MKYPHLFDFNWILVTWRDDSIMTKNHIWPVLSLHSYTLTVFLWSCRDVTMVSAGLDILSKPAAEVRDN